MEAEEMLNRKIPIFFLFSNPLSKQISFVLASFIV